MSYYSSLVLHALAHGIDAEAAADLKHVTGIADRLAADRCVYVSIEPCLVSDKGLRLSESGWGAIVRCSRAWYDFPTGHEKFGDYPKCAFTAIARTGNGTLEMIEPIHFSGANP